MEEEQDFTKSWENNSTKENEEDDKEEGKKTKHKRDHVNPKLRLHLK